MKWIKLRFMALVVPFVVATPVHADSMAGIDVYGLGSGVTNAYYQMRLSRDHALRLAVYSGAETSFYGFYKLYYRAIEDNMKPYLEGGGGFAAGGVAVAANVGIEIPVSVVIVDPYLGLVTGSGGTGYGIGLNVGYRF